MIITTDALQVLNELLRIGVPDTVDTSGCVKDGILTHHNNRTQMGLSVYAYPERVEVNILKGGNTGFIERMPYHNGVVVSTLNIYTFAGLLSNIVTDNAIFIVKDTQLNGLQLAAAIRTHCPELMKLLGVTFGDLKIEGDYKLQHKNIT